MLAAALWALLAASSLLVGAFVALTFSVPTRVVGQAMGFGAGALVGSLAYELIPHTSVSEAWIWFWFGSGAITFFVADGLVERYAARPRPRRGGAATDASAGPTGGGGVQIALGALLDGVPESLVLGMGIAVGGTVSIGFLVAVFVSNVPESLSSAGSMQADRSAASIYRLWLGIALASAIAGAAGYGIATHLPGVDGTMVQAFAGGAVLTMLADSMFPEAFEDGGRTVGLLTALGFAVAAVLTTLE